MSNVKYSFKIKRLAFIVLGKNRIPVGEVDEYSRIEDEITVNVRLSEKLSQDLCNQIEKNPAGLQIVEIPGPPESVLIIPSRPKLIA